MRLRLILSAALVAAATAVAADAARLPHDLSARHWTEITFDGKPANTYRACGADCVEVDTDRSVSLIAMPVAIDLTRTPALSWEWKVDGQVAATDLTTKGRDDRAVALYVTFPYDPDTASLSDRLLRPLVELARGKDAPGRGISYVWSGYGKPGDVVDSPFLGAAHKMVVTRNGAAPTGQWLTEHVDVAADHERLFGSRPKSVAQVMIGADSDDTGGKNRAFVRHIAFSSH